MIAYCLSAQKSLKILATILLFGSYVFDVSMILNPAGVLYILKFNVLSFLMERSIFCTTLSCVIFEVDKFFAYGFCYGHR